MLESVSEPYLRKVSLWENHHGGKRPKSRPLTTTYAFLVAFA